MKSISKYLFIIIGVLFCSIALAQEPPTAMLSSADVTKFIKTYKPLINDLEALDVKYVTDVDVSSPAAAMAKAYAANAEVKAIFSKHGWSEDFAKKISAITAAYGYLAMEKEMNLDEMPDEQKAMAKQMLDQAGQQFKAMVHDKDINIVRDKYDDLKVMMDNL